MWTLQNWRLICKKSGIADGTFHDLRETCITEWLEKGMTSHEVQRHAGHASIDATMKYYAGIRESMINRARQAGSATLSDNLSTLLARAAQNDQNVRKEALLTTAQVIDTLVLCR